MATYKLQSSKRRAELIYLLLELNKRAERIYERMLVDGFPVNKAYAAAQEIMDDASALADELVWIYQPTFKVDPANGIEYWHFDAVSGNEKIKAEPASLTKVPIFEMLSNDDVILVRNAEDPENNGEYTINAVATFDTDLTVTEGLTTENTDDETAEIIWLEKYYSG